jgi:hypothetical protein
MDPDNTPWIATIGLIVSNVILFPSIYFCARRGYTHETVISFFVLAFTSMYYSCATRGICFDSMGISLKALKWIFTVMMFHLINTMYIFYLDIRPRKFKSVPHLMVIIMLSVLLFDTADNHQVLVSVNIYTIIVNVLVLLTWFGWLFIREGPTFFMEKYPIPSLISGFIGIGFSALGGYFYAQAQWTLLKQSSVDPNASDQGFFTQNGLLRPWVVFLLWHIAVNTASLFLMTTPTNNILISVFKLFDPPVKRSKRKERPITDRMRGLDMYTETEMSATDGETDGGTDTEGDMPRERGNSLLNRRRRKIRPAIGFPSVPVITEEPTNHSHDNNTNAATITVTAPNPSSASPKKERNGPNNVANNSAGAKNRKNSPKLSDKSSTGNTNVAQKSDSAARDNDGWSTAGAQKNK